MGQQLFQPSQIKQLFMLEIPGLKSSSPDPMMLTSYHLPPGDAPQSTIEVKPKPGSGTTICFPASPPHTQPVEAVARVRHARTYYKTCPRLEAVSGSRPRWSIIHVLPPTDTLDASMVKTGKFVTRAEANNLELIGRCTTIPAPKLYDYWLDEETGWWCIWMSKVDGVPLDHYYRLLSAEAKEEVVKEAQNCIEQMKAIEPPDGKVAAADGQPSCDQMLQERRQVYANEVEFRRHFVSAFIDRAADEREYRKVNDNGDPEMSMEGVYMVEEIDSYDIDVDIIAHEIDNLVPDNNERRLVFAHGNLTPRNIFVIRGNKGMKITGILDWSQAGFYPAYWEYVKSSCCDQDETVGESDGPLFEPGFLKDRFPDRMLRRPYLSEAKAYRRAYRKVWGYSTD